MPPSWCECSKRPSRRYAAGQTDQANLLRVQLKQTRIGPRIAETERVGAPAAINRLTHDPPDNPIGLVTDLPPRALPATETVMAQVRVGGQSVPA